MQLEISEMTDADASEIVNWRYESPYDLYNLSGITFEEGVRTYTNPGNGYYSVHDENGGLVAFVCFGEEARVPGGDYGIDALDVGCGMRPDLTGHGLGPAVIEAAVSFAQEKFGEHHLRATVAAFNQRALRACSRAGFDPETTFQRSSDGRSFVILQRRQD